MPLYKFKAICVMVLFNNNNNNKHKGLTTSYLTHMT